jgi:excisionase family DNA binding protein
VTREELLADLFSEHGQTIYLPGEVAAIFQVSPRTINGWSRAGRLPSSKTLGGHHRFARSTVLAAAAKSGLAP